MKLGLQLGYWGAQPPTDALEKILEAERLGFDTVFTAEAWGSDAFGPLAWWGSQTSTIRLGTSIVQLSGAHARVVRDARADPRPPLGRPARARPRRVGTAGRRGLVRRAVRQAAGAHARVRRHRAPGARPRGTGDERRTALPAALRRPGLARPRQAAAPDHPPAAPRPAHLARRRGSEERRAHGRDRRRLAAHLLLAEGRGHVPRLARRGLRAPGAAKVRS